MEATVTSNAAQRELWNGDSANAWSAQQKLLDAIFKPYEDLLVDQAASRAGPSELDILDVGCGAGATTLALARAFPAAGRHIGIDLSDRLVDLARRRAEQEELRAHFILDDAQTHHYPAGFFDLIVSRFGVMFFDDPAAAFTGLRRATRHNGELVFFAWRGPEENPFSTTAEKAAAPLLPALAPSRAGRSGQFAFADPGRIQAILADSGWSDVRVQPVDIVCKLPRRDLMPYLSTMGPVGRVLRTVDHETRSKTLDAMRLGYEPFIDGDEVQYPTACWIVTAKNAACSGAATRPQRTSSTQAPWLRTGEERNSTS